MKIFNLLVMLACLTTTTNAQTFRERGVRMPPGRLRVYANGDHSCNCERMPADVIADIVLKYTADDIVMSQYDVAIDTVLDLTGNATASIRGMTSMVGQSIIESGNGNSLVQLSPPEMTELVIQGKFDDGATTTAFSGTRPLSYSVGARVDFADYPHALYLSYAPSATFANNFDTLTFAPNSRINQVLIGGANLSRDIFNDALPRPAVGDSNFDGVFDSSDLIQVFAAGQYGRLNPAGRWSNGDWNRDRFVNSSDLILAFAEGDYVSGAVTVPEPRLKAVHFMLGLLFVYACCRAIGGLDR